MDLKIKKYLYLINDLSGRLLKKERLAEAASAKILRRLLIIVILALTVSFIFNIYFLFK